MTYETNSYGIKQEQYGQNIDPNIMKKSLQKILDVISQGKIDFADKNYNRLATAEKRFRADTFYYPPQFHNYIEIIFAIEGQLHLMLNKRWFVYSPSKAIAILPGVIHSERYFTRSSAYKLLWIIIAPTSCHSHITAHNKVKGYHITARTPMISDKFSRENIHRLALEIKSTNDRLSRIKFQSSLMNTICNTLDNMDNHLSQNLSVNEQIVNQVRFYIDSHYNEQISLSKLASMVHYNRCYLNTLFKKYTGMPINRYLIEVRLSKAEELLADVNLELKQIAYKVGFNDPLYFSRIFTRYRGLPPSKFRSKLK